MGRVPSDKSDNFQEGDDWGEASKVRQQRSGEERSFNSHLVVEKVFGFGQQNFKQISSAVECKLDSGLRVEELRQHLFGSEIM